LADARVGPIRADNQVIARAHAVAELDVSCRAQRTHRGAETHGDAGVAYGAGDNVVQRRAHHADACRILRAVEARQLHHALHLAVLIAIDHLRIAEARGDAGFEQPDRFQRAQGRPLHRDADAEHLPGGMKLDQFDRAARSLERGREHHAGEPGTDDEDLHEPATRYAMPPTISNAPATERTLNTSSRSTAAP